MKGVSLFGCSGLEGVGALNPHPITRGTCRVLPYRDKTSQAINTSIVERNSCSHDPYGFLEYPTQVVSSYESLESWLSFDMK